MSDVSDSSAIVEGDSGELEENRRHPLVWNRSRENSPVKEASHVSRTPNEVCELFELCEPYILYESYVRSGRAGDAVREAAERKVHSPGQEKRLLIFSGHVACD